MQAPGKRWQQAGIIAAVVGTMVAVIAYLFPNEIKTPPPILKDKLVLDRKVFGIEMPNFVDRNKPRGSIVFAPTEEINRSGVVTAYLDLRPEGGGQWEKTELYELGKIPTNMKLCDIEGAEFNRDSGRFWFGLQAHCVPKDAGSSGHLNAPCSYNLENSTIWVTLGPGEQVVAQLAEQGKTCN
ncbi:MAG: hypothetical protein R3F54_25495 [Alphaproteobacteria bacterium]